MVVFSHNHFFKLYLINYFLIILISTFFLWLTTYLENHLTCEIIKLNFTNGSRTISKIEMNTVSFDPIEGEGAMGKGVIIPPDEILKMKQLFKINNYNLLVSDRIPLNRTLPDIRMDSCRIKKYTENLPSTSVIIIFHNEAWSVLLRTIWSIVTRTPKHLLKEIILVDDASDREFLKFPLDQYIKEIPVSINIIRMVDRKGIVSARLVGANAASGEILTFFDAHCECTDGWAEPLLARIKYHRNTIISPIIDIISINDFSYTETESNIFFWISWNLGFGMGISNVKDDEPIKTPIMAGGIFAIDRKYFFKMGSYDPEMMIWGGENLEMSFRIWQCGGKIEIHPCSHVGHVNRIHPPYTFPNGGPIRVIKSNFERAALVWMDEWSDFYFMYNSLNNRDLINVTDRLNLRKRLNCKPFSWYLKNIWSDNFFPADNRFFGKIVWLNGTTDLIKVYNEFLYNITLEPIPTTWSEIIQEIWYNSHNFLKLIPYKDNFCLRPHINTSLYAMEDTFAVITKCISDKTFQDNFVITENGLIMTNGYTCLNLNPIWSVNDEYMVLLNKCYVNNKTYWKYDVVTQRIFKNGTDLCLTVEEDLLIGKHFVTAKKCCRSYGYYQKWGLIPLTWKM